VKSTVATMATDFALGGCTRPPRVHFPPSGRHLILRRWRRPAACSPALRPGAPGACARRAGCRGRSQRQAAGDLLDAYRDGGEAGDSSVCAEPTPGTSPRTRKVNSNLEIAIGATKKRKGTRSRGAARLQDFPPEPACRGAGAFILSISPSRLSIW
jgi:hypothetical protein